MVAQLPIELLQIIFQDAKPESLRACRLVDRQWSLTKLSALAHSPLAKHVKTIEYHTDQLPDYPRQEWEAKIDARPSMSAYRNTLGEPRWTQFSKAYDELPRHNYSPAQLEMGWLAFQAYCSEQERWGLGQGGLVMKECICRLHNLQQVKMSCAKPFRGSINDTPFWRNIKSQILVGPDAWMYSGGHDGRLEALSALLMLTAIGHRAAVNGVKAVEILAIDLPVLYSFHHLCHVPPRAFHATLPDFDERDSTESDSDGGYHSTRPIRYEDCSSKYKIVVDAFRPLKHLAIQCPSVVEEDLSDIGAHSQAKEAEQFLAAAVDLRSLDLGFGEPHHTYEEADDEANHFDSGLELLLSSGQTYPHLTDLKISAAFPSDLFKEFLIRHEGTLKKLDIFDSLCDDWDEVLTTVAKDLNLDDVYVESLWTPPANDVDNSTLILGEGIDADDGFSQAMRIFLQTGEGSVPQIEEYDGWDMDDEDEDDMGGENDDDDGMDADDEDGDED